MTRAGTMRKCWGALALLAAVTLQACGGGSPTNPSPTGTPTPTPTPTLTVTTIDPAKGPTIGGTVVTFTGTNFSSGAAVTFGGTAATNVTVDSATSLKATTPVHAAGAVDVVVTVGAQTVNRAQAFTYEIPSATTNNPPVVQSLKAQGTRANEPANFADLDEEIAVAATVQDAETPVEKLTFDWTAEGGTFSGTGPQVKWRAPKSAKSGTNLKLTVTVIEKYQGLDGNGLPVDKENRATRSVTVGVFDSAKDISDMAETFLVEFSQQKQSPSTIVRNFAPSCGGGAAEQSDVTKNQRCYTITSYSVGSANTSVKFGGSCGFRGRGGDGCAGVAVTWKSTRTSASASQCDGVAAGASTTARGTDWVNAIFDGNRWWLCDSDFEGSVTGAAVYKK